MGIKIFKAVVDTTLNGKFIRKGTEVPFTDEPKNKNFKFVREEATETKKTTKK